MCNSFFYIFVYVTFCVECERRRVSQLLTHDLKTDSAMAKKNYVLDTNVILHDPKCIESFQDNDLYIPITVLEELDKFKTGYEQINYNARVFARLLDSIACGEILSHGVKIGDEGARLFVYTEGQHHAKVSQVFSNNIPDHRILSAALTLSEEHPTQPTILVTKDVNLRMKALSLGLKAEDYTSDKVQADDLTTSGTVVYEGIPAEVIDALYAHKTEGIPVEELHLPTACSPNTTCILKSERNTALVRVNNQAQTARIVDKQTLMGITPRNAEQSLAFDILTDPNISLVALTGTAGTGKTLLALAAALAQCKEYDQIYLARPIVSLSNKDLGFLPGDYKEKVRPYMQPLFDNLNVIKSQLGASSPKAAELDEMVKQETLVIEALAYIRGRSLANVICIIDEAQNLTPQEIKTVITRAGEHTKMIFTGDVQQIDSPYLDARSNGLAYMISRMAGQDFFAHVNLVQGERSELSDKAAKLL